jgi:hypothetical protein
MNQLKLKASSLLSFGALSPSRRIQRPLRSGLPSGVPKNAEVPLRPAAAEIFKQRAARKGGRPTIGALSSKWRPWLYASSNSVPNR